MVFLLRCPPCAGEHSVVHPARPPGPADEGAPAPHRGLHPALLPPAPQGAALHPLHLPGAERGGFPRLLLHVRRETFIVKSSPHIVYVAVATSWLCYGLLKKI